MSETFTRFVAACRGLIRAVAIEPLGCDGSAIQVCERQAVELVELVIS